MGFQLFSNVSGPSIRFFAWLIRLEHRARLIVTVVEAVLLDQLLDDRLLIARVVDDEVARQADVRRLAAQQPRAQRVKRRDPHRAAVRAEQRLDARAHLLRRLVGERDREHAVARREAFGDEIRDAMRDDARLPRARARENQQRAVRVEDGRLLFGIEGGEEVHEGASRSAASVRGTVH